LTDLLRKNGNLDSLDARRLCRDWLKAARLAVLQDAEEFSEVLFAIERIGSLASGTIDNLNTYGPYLSAIAAASPLFNDVPSVRPEFHRPFERLYPLVQRARNDALHQGAYARHLAGHAVELAIMLEDALMANARQIGDFMVMSPVCAEPWHPLSYARQQMLGHSFSFLPVRLETTGEWRLLSDAAVARVVREATDYRDRAKRLTATVAEATSQFGLQLLAPELVAFDMPVARVLERADSIPVLVVGAHRELLGIVTPFDLL
jgi:hypothetical protein